MQQKFKFYNKIKNMVVPAAARNYSLTAILEHGWFGRAGKWRGSSGELMFGIVNITR